ncbi:hypothetical protein GETHLI_05840 [Geothrix limicola]|uniref:Histidine kinase/HSP90-like ATPase domain-containing protein n=1 Tax=Geothrix limicola TaxID=2927978 RepID=A0ABQ5QB82_9BACT|nr:histidine kinase [Geothrix limicola]GLH72082.1 hypothetical protein GETHLI_05840 [Geothrix limicola]
MILRDALQALSRRSRRPLILGLIGGMSLFNFGMLALSLVVQRLSPHSIATPPIILNARMVSTTLLGCVFLFIISPFGWQWTGDARRMARPARGILQACALHAMHALASLSIGWPNVRRYLEFATASAQSKGPHLYPIMLLGLLMGFGFTVVISFALAFWEAKNAEKAEALRHSEEARWNLLKAQMSPHVLLNSLNGLAELVREDTEAAVKGMRDLAEIYRQLLALGETPSIPLGEERKLLSRYLDVEKLRLGEALRVEWDWDPALDALPAMPLLLQPLVENAIKHGVAADPQGGLIRVSGRREGASLVLTVSNTGQHPSPSKSKGTGIGLRNLKSRLELAYGTRASFDLVRESPWTRAILTLPLEEKP